MNRGQTVFLLFFLTLLILNDRLQIFVQVPRSAGLSKMHLDRFASDR